MLIDNTIFALTIIVFVSTFLIANYRIRKMKRSESKQDALR
jgi:hypothetical protein